jgi:hypothetical protein
MIDIDQDVRVAELEYALKNILAIVNEWDDDERMTAEEQYRWKHALKTAQKLVEKQ